MIIPFDRVIWDAKQIAEYLGVNYHTFLKQVRYQDGFPAPLSAFPGHPKWSAKAVSDWALAGDKSREKHASDEIIP
jgi:hypothetical protein